MCTLARSLCTESSPHIYSHPHARLDAHPHAPGVGATFSLQCKRARACAPFSAHTAHSFKDLTWVRPTFRSHAHLPLVLLFVHRAMARSSCAPRLAWGMCVQRGFNALRTVVSSLPTPRPSTRSSTHIAAMHNLFWFALLSAHPPHPHPTSHY